MEEVDRPEVYQEIVKSLLSPKVKLFGGHSAASLKMTGKLSSDSVASSRKKVKKDYLCYPSLKKVKEISEMKDVEAKKKAISQLWFFTQRLPSMGRAYQMKIDRLPEDHDTLMKTGSSCSA